MRKQFNLHIDCENAAFDPSPLPELARILLSLGSAAENGTMPVNAPLYDINGNRVGHVTLGGNWNEDRG